MEENRIKEIAEIPEESRKKLGEYLEKVRLDKKIGFNQLALKSNINVKSLNEILYGKSKRTNPFYLQRIALALRIDYKELYRIVGYLIEEDFDENKKLVSTCSQIEKELCGEFSSLSDEEKGKVLIFIKEFIKK